MIFLVPEILISAQTTSQSVCNSVTSELTNSFEMASKILEHVVVSSIMTHADTHNILYPLQHGLRRFRSCETQLLEFIDDVSKT